jgi:hypothetical protein
MLLSSWVVPATVLPVHQLRLHPVQVPDREVTLDELFASRATFTVVAWDVLPVTAQARSIVSS